MTETVPLKARIRATYGPDPDDPTPEAVTRGNSLFESHGTLNVFIDDPIRLDLGAGPIVRPGHKPMGRDYGSEIFPLTFEDCTVDEIVASHVLEHFSHRIVAAVVREWARVLKRGGRLRIAVPDFAKIARWYLDGRPELPAWPFEFVLMGAQRDGNDFHRSVFDRDRLSKLFTAAGLSITGTWQSDIADNANDPVSLNLEGRKL